MEDPPIYKHRGRPPGPTGGGGLGLAWDGHGAEIYHSNINGLDERIIGILGNAIYINALRMAYGCVMGATGLDVVAHQPLRVRK